MRTLLAIFATAIGILSIAACSDCEPGHDAGHAVGIARLEFRDLSRSNWSGSGPRPLVSHVWYPAAAGSTMQTVHIPPDRPVFIGGNAARDADFAEGNERFPLVVMSHGTGGAGMQMMWLGRELARMGFVAVAVDHHGNTAAEEAYDPRGFRLPWERALDLSAVIDQILTDPKFGPRIDPARIGAVGYSLGGYSVIALAGGLTDLSKFEVFCASDARDATCDPQSEFPMAESEFLKLAGTDPLTAESLSRHSNSFRDRRVKSFVVLSPALVQAFSEQSLQDIEAPFLIISGREDMVAPNPTNADQLARSLSRAQTIEVDSADHYVFLNRCNLKGRLFVPVCRDPKGGDRAEVHQKVAGAIGRHFLSSL